MRKLLCVLMSVLLVLSFVACSQSDVVSQAEYNELKQENDEPKEQDAQISSPAVPSTQPEETTEEKPKTSQEESQTETEEDTKPSGKFDPEVVLSQLEINEYPYSSSSAEYLFLTIKNNSEYNIVVSASAKFYNGEDLIGTRTKYQEAFEHGTETVLYFMLDEEYTSVEYDISVSEETWYQCVVSQLSYETTSAKNKEMISVTNNGEYAAFSVECYALFFKDGNVVDYSRALFIDDDCELKPGKTITSELDCYKEYDDVKFYFIGSQTINPTAEEQQG